MVGEEELLLTAQFRLVPAVAVAVTLFMVGDDEV